MTKARILRVEAAPLRVPLREPFVIATARMDATRALQVMVELEDAATGRRATGRGEAATLPPVTSEDEGTVRAAVERIAGVLTGRVVSGLEDATTLANETLAGRPVARAGIETALLDALAQLGDEPLHRLLRAGSTALPLRTDITIPIGETARMVELARQHRAVGFDTFKVKVGKDDRHDREALVAIHNAVENASFRLDANEGFDAAGALRLLDDLLAAGLRIECFEQPCPRDAIAAMAEVTAKAGVPVVADESLRTDEDLSRLLERRAADAVNLKLVKVGGPLAALVLGQRARAAGLQLMAGAMVETRLGLSAMLHVVCALGGVDWVDLDTAFLLAHDPFRGGYRSEGSVLHPIPGVGHTVRPATGSED